MVMEYYRPVPMVPWYGHRRIHDPRTISFGPGPARPASSKKSTIYFIAMSKGIGEDGCVIYVSGSDMETGAYTSPGNFHRENRVNSPSFRASLCPIPGFHYLPPPPPKTVSKIRPHRRSSLQFRSRFAKGIPGLGEGGEGENRVRI